VVHCNHFHMWCIVYHHRLWCIVYHHRLWCIVHHHRLWCIVTATACGASPSSPPMLHRLHCYLWCGRLHAHAVCMCLFVRVCVSGACTRTGPYTVHSPDDCSLASLPACQMHPACSSNAPCLLVKCTQPACQMHPAKSTQTIWSSLLRKLVHALHTGKQLCSICRMKN